MAYLGTEKLKELINSEKVIGPKPNLDRIKSGAYELSLGEEVFRTDSKDKKKEILKNDKDQITINPGQFALLLTQETVKIPLNKIAFISIKAGIKLRGLINVSGFHVDPGFHGNLVFSVYNAGSASISLQKGEPYFLIWFAELLLAPNEATTYNGEHKDQDSIPLRYIDAHLSAELASPNVLLDKINDNYKLLDARATNREYIAKTVIGIIIVVGIKFMFDYVAYGKGYNNGFEDKAKIMAADSMINIALIKHKNLLIEIDSALADQKTLLIEIDSLKKEKKRILKP